MLLINQPAAASRTTPPPRVLMISVQSMPIAGLSNRYPKAKQAEFGTPSKPKNDSDGRRPVPESRFHNDFAAQRGWGRLGRFRGGGRFCDQLSGWFCGLGLIP